jgi:hypothetical protein
MAPVLAIVAGTTLGALATARVVTFLFPADAVATAPVIVIEEGQQVELVEVLEQRIEEQADRLPFWISVRPAAVIRSSDFGGEYGSAVIEIRTSLDERRRR